MTGRFTSTSPTLSSRRDGSRSPAPGNRSPLTSKDDNEDNFVASEEGNFNENALPEAYTNPQQRMEKQARDRKIKAFVEWLDDLPNKGVVHLLELLGVNEDAKSAAKIPGAVASPSGKGGIRATTGSGATVIGSVTGGARTASSGGRMNHSR